MTRITTAALCLAGALLGAGCGMRMGYRGSYREGVQSGAYAGPWAALAFSTAERTASVGASPYLVVQADYQLAGGPDFATVGAGMAYAPDALGWHNALTFTVAWEPWNGQGLHLSLCDGYGNWGTVTACARWSTKGYWAVDLGAGLNPTRLEAEAHEGCRDGCGGGGWDWD